MSQSGASGNSGLTFDVTTSSSAQTASSQPLMLTEGATLSSAPINAQFDQQVGMELNSNHGSTQGISTPATQGEQTPRPIMDGVVAASVGSWINLNTQELSPYEMPPRHQRVPVQLKFQTVRFINDRPILIMAR